MDINNTTSALLAVQACFCGDSGGLLLLVKQHLALLVAGWMTQGSCGGAVIGWVQVYYISIILFLDS